MREKGNLSKPQRDTPQMSSVFDEKKLKMGKEGASVKS